MSRKLIIDGNAVYEIDENCMLKKKLGHLVEKQSVEKEEVVKKNSLWKESTKIIRENK